ncbi:MAG: LapA family protein [Deltaproteobacteria bacterium]|nr:LapA family protein [Deltaproteobacteria bacterium]
MIFYLIIDLLVIIGTAIFIFQNGMNVPIKFLFWHTESSLSFITFIFFLIGALFIFVIFFPKIIKGYFKVKKMNKELKTINKEIKDSKK